ncbi:MAG: nucleotidyltransferase domain-containing protein [Thermoproteota archaeon]
MKISEPYGDILSNLLQTFRKRLEDKLVSFVIYGSVARGDARKDSDIDMLIIAEGLPKGRLQRNRLFEEIESNIEEPIEKLFNKGYSIDFSPILKTPEEAVRLSPLYLDMVEDAIILYDKDRFFEKVLARLQKRLRELGARRVRMGNKWYWILKDRYEMGEIISIE